KPQVAAATTAMAITAPTTGPRCATSHSIVLPATTWNSSGFFSSLRSSLCANGCDLHQCSGLPGLRDWRRRRSPLLLRWLLLPDLSRPVNRRDRTRSRRPPGPGAVVRQRRARGNRSSGRRGAALASLAPIRGLLSAAGERRGGAWPGRRVGSELSPDRSDFAGRFRLATRRLD